MTKQCKHFTLEIEALKGMLTETKEDKAKNAQQHMEKNKKGLMNANQPIGEEEETSTQSQSSEIIAFTPASLGVEKHVEKRNYASVTASKSATPPNNLGLK